MGRSGFEDREMRREQDVSAVVSNEFECLTCTHNDCCNLVWGGWRFKQSERPKNLETVSSTRRLARPPKRARSVARTFVRRTTGPWTFSVATCTPPDRSAMQDGAALTRDQPNFDGHGFRSRAATSPTSVRSSESEVQQPRQNNPNFWSRDWGEDRIRHT